MKRIIKAVMALGVMALGFTGVTQAALSDALTVTITPNAQYSIDIDTGALNGGFLDLGAVDLGNSTQTVLPATVTILSSYLQTDITLQGDITSAVDAWDFDDNTGNTENDNLAAWATFTTVARTTAPALAGDYFSGTQPADDSSDVIDATPRYVGTSNSGNDTDHFEANGEFGFKDMDNLPPSPAAASKSHLWLYFRLPPSTTEPDDQFVQITLTAVQPN